MVEKCTQQRRLTVSFIVFFTTKNGYFSVITSLEQKECDDCGKKEVEWASVKKGTVICSECFCFHSYLGKFKKTLNFY